MLNGLSPYSNRWCCVHPAAKALFAIMSMIAAFASSSPGTSLLLALLIAVATVAGAGVPLRRFLRAAAPALLFITAGSIPILFSVNAGTGDGFLSLSFASSELPHATTIYSRSVASVAALLFLALTTPLSDIISLLRNCHLPEIILDMMTLCYRTIFVLSTTLEETRTAQSARLGYSTTAISFRSLGGLVANLAVGLWHRSNMLHQAAEARNSDGAIRFLERSFDATKRHILLSAIAGSVMIILTRLLP